MRGPTKIPCRQMNFKIPHASFEDISLAEVGTIQLEFNELARQTHNSTFEVCEKAIAA